MSDDNRFYVYVLFRPDLTPCYVGKGQGNRINDHKSTSRNRQLGHIIANAKEPILRHKVAVNLTEELAHALEIALIADYGRQIHGGMLVNKTNGGDGTSGYKPPKCKGAAHSLKMSGRVLSDEHRAKIGVANRGKVRTEAHRKALSITKTGVPQSEEHRLAISRSSKGVPRGPYSDARKAAISAAKKGVPMTLEARSKMSLARMGMPVSDQARKKIGAAVKASWVRRRAAKAK